ncbi:MAG: hypothetical protein AAF702_18295 [Chloroflexota bacterium]
MLRKSLIIIFITTLTYLGFVAHTIYGSGVHLESAAHAADLSQEETFPIFLPMVAWGDQLRFGQRDVETVYGSSLNIYTDEFGPLWRDQWTWSIKVDNAEWNTVYAGKHALGLTFTEGWGGYAIAAADALPLSEYEFLQFWVHGGTTGLDKTIVTLIDESNNWGNLIPITAPANRWTRVQVPLTAIGTMSKMKAVVWHERSGNLNGEKTFYLDNIQLTSQDRPSPTHPEPEPLPTQTVIPLPEPKPTDSPTSIPSPMPTQVPTQVPTEVPSPVPSPKGCSPMLMGVNLPSLNRGYGADFATVEEWNDYHTYDHQDARNVFAELSANGVNSVRWWVFLDGRGAPEFDGRGYVTGVDATLLPSMADALIVAAEYDIQINFSLWSFEMLAHQGIGSTPNSGSHGELFYDDAAFESYRQNVLIPMANYPTRDGYTIATHPKVMFEIINEPEWALNDTDQPPNAEIVDTITTAQLQKFVAKNIGELHRQGAVMVGVGQAAIKFIADRSQVKGAWGNLYADHKLEVFDKEGALDYYSPHYYGWMDGDGVTWNYNPYDYTKEQMGIDKPLIIGETAASQAHRELDLALQQGYDGVWIWTYDGIDAMGSWADAKGAFQTFAQEHPEAYHGKCN